MEKYSGVTLFNKIDRQALVDIVDAAQKRTICEEVDLLLGNSPAPSEWLMQHLGTNASTGIPGDEADIARRRQLYGTNRKEPAKPPSFFSLLLEALDDFILKILIVASILSIAIEVGTAEPEKRSLAWIEGFAIMVAVIVCSLVTAVNNYEKEKQFLKLNEVADSRKKVSLVRGGEMLELHQDELVVGDIVTLSEGMEVPTDGLLFVSNEITMDESAMTGESDAIKKNTVDKCKQKAVAVLEDPHKAGHIGKHDVPSPIILSGTKLLTGAGKMIVLVVGELSCLGKIRELITVKTEEETPLQEKLEKLAKHIGKFGLYSAIAIVGVLLLRFAIEKGISKHWQTSTDLPELFHFFIIGITVVVVAIPEGLPLAVTLSLAYSVKKMLDDNNLVRKMQACETMGGADMICSDKTGTLTLNQMTLTCYYNTRRVDFHNYKPELKISDYMKDDFAELFLIQCCVNSTAVLRPEQKGSSTEVALIKLVEQMRFNYETIRHKYPAALSYPFSSARKRMSTFIELNGRKLIFTKGASEMVLRSCNQMYNQETQQLEPLTSERVVQIEKAILGMAEESLRTLCFAYKDIGIEDIDNADNLGIYDVEKKNMVFICIVGVKDIPRPEVPHAIEACKLAGIRVRMVTGDNIVTARAIAREVGIIDPKNTDSLVMEGGEFVEKIGGVVCKKCRTAVCPCERDQKKAEEKDQKPRIDVIANMDVFKELVPRLDVLARSRPTDKYALVTGLKEMNHVVAVTGDGTNDAPALRKADVGFAMGINGTEVARQASAIILLDDNFNSIVRAVMWGRNIYDSIRKFVQFQLTVNVVAVLLTLIGAVLLKEDILKPIQMLWINLIMDTLASLALATEPPTEKLLERPPHKRNDYIISKRMMKNIIIQSIFQIVVLMILLFAGDLFLPEFPGEFDKEIGTNLQAKYRNGVVDNNGVGFMRSGRAILVDGTLDYKPVREQYNTASRHYTFIFNAFVMMQIFNFLNSRKLGDELNVFEGIFSNWLFPVIVVAILALEIIIVTFGGLAFSVFKDFGLHIYQWLICVGIGMIGLIVGLLGKMPCCRPSKEFEEAPEEEEAEQPTHIELTATKGHEDNRVAQG